MSNNVLKPVLKQEGKGLVSNIRQLFFGRDELVRGPRALMVKHKDKIIKKLVVVREPISSAINAVIKIGTVFGDKYDKLYHLYVIITLDDNTKLILEKNSSVNIEKFKRVKKGAELLEVLIKKDISLINAFQNIQKGYKDKRDMFAYDSLTNNCQRFILTFLKKNIRHFTANVEIQKFIKQDLKGIFKNSNILVRIMKRITNTTNNLSTLIGSGKK